MRWTLLGRSPDFEDRRATTARAIRASIGLGAALLVGLSLLLGEKVFRVVDPAANVDASRRPLVPASPTRTASKEEIPVAFVSSMFDDMQDTWTRLFSSMGKRYIEAQMVLFRDAVESACGHSQPATGSFYCPVDQKVYVDLGVYQELREHFGESGDLGQAYVLAHEIGHHVQTLFGIEQRVRRLKAEQPADQLSMRLELQADCLTGVWWHSRAERRILQRGDIERALNAAAAIGAVRRYGVSTNHNPPGALTHGSSAQRVVSFKRGFEAGQVSACDISCGKNYERRVCGSQ